MSELDPARGGDGEDTYLTFLTEAQANRVRMLTRQAFAERGREVLVFGDHVRDDQGTQFGLWNVAVACKNEPRGEPAWPGVIAQHVQTITATSDSNPFLGVSPDDIRSRTYVRLVPADQLPPERRKNYSYMRELAPGLLEALALDLPDAVVTFGDQQVEQFGGLAALREAGLANLRALPVEQHERLDAPGGGHFELLLGESVYTASRVLVMPELVRQLFGPVDTRYGVLAAVAHRHQAALHVIRDQSVIPSINDMATFALVGYSDSAGSLSPNVYWWRDGTWRRISEVGAEGGIFVEAGEDLLRVLEDVASVKPDQD